MGRHTSYEAMALRWAELCNDRSLDDLPYKIELNAQGVIEMSPTSNRHARFQGTIAGELMRQLPHGTVFTECPVATDEGVRVPDVAWVSPELYARQGDATPFFQAPDICVEVRSPSNYMPEIAMKMRAYLDAGAVEVWVIDNVDAWTVFDANGLRADSRFGVVLSLSVAPS